MSETEETGSAKTPINAMCGLIRKTYAASVEGGELLGRDVTGLKARAKQLATMLADGSAKDRKATLAALVAVELLAETEAG